MSYTQALYDNFNDASIDTSLWETPDGTTGVTETTSLALTPLTSFPELRGKTVNSLSTGGLWGVKVTPSGTTPTTNAVSFYFGLVDTIGSGASNAVTLEMQPYTSGAGFAQVDALNGASVSSSSVTNQGLGPNWTSGNWMAVGMTGSLVTWYKSSDGNTWTEIAHTTAGGTFNTATLRPTFVASITTGSTTYRINLDDASFFTPSASVHGKVRSSGAWVTPTAVKVRSGGAWVVPTAIKVRSGGAWVTPTN